MKFSTVVLKYRVVGGLHVDNDTAQVYWKAIFAYRKADVKQAKVQVKFPEQVVNNIENFQSFGIPADVRQVDAKTIEFVAQEVIAPQQELEVQVTFCRASIDVKIPQWQSSGVLNGSPWFWIIAFLIGASLVAAIFGRWIWFFAFVMAIPLIAAVFGIGASFIAFFIMIPLLAALSGGSSSGGVGGGGGGG